MRPILIQFGSLSIYTYGPIMALAFLVAFFLIYHIVKFKNDDLEFYMDLYLWLIVFGILGAKVLYIITDWHSFIERPLDLLNPRKGGLVWYGGMLAATGFVYFYTRHRGKPFLRVTDVLSPPMMLGLAIGRWGCLMGGCCYGKACSLTYPFGIVYPETVSKIYRIILNPWNPDFPLTTVLPTEPVINEVAGIHVHPSPIYESICTLLIAIVCYLVLRRTRRQGLTTYLTFLLYPLARFILEFWRGDVVRGFLFEGQSFALSTSQFISALVFFPVLYPTIRSLRRPAPEEKPKPVIKPDVKKSERKKSKRKKKQAQPPGNHRS